MRALVSGGLCPSNAATLGKLQELHPDAGHQWTDVERAMPTVDEPRIMLHGRTFAKAVRDMPRGAAPGVSGFRPDWIRLMGGTAEPANADGSIPDGDGGAPMELLRFTQLLMNGDLGPAATKVYGGAKLLALQKDNGEPRPLAIVVRLFGAWGRRQ